MIKIDKINEIYLQILCSTEISLEIREHFNCYAKNYKFQPRFRAKIWNGKVSLYDHQNHLLPIGLLDKLIDFFNLNNYQYEFTFNVDELFDKKAFDNVDLILKDIFKDSKFIPRDYQVNAIRNALYCKKGIIESATGCHKKGTKIIMFDGTLKNVEDIIVGDKLMGPDNKKRIVQKLFTGKEEMYEIISKKGKSYIVNKNHVLHLHRYKDKKCKEIVIENITVENYLKQNRTFKHLSNLKYNDVEIEFNNKFKNSSPYSFGYKHEYKFIPEKYKFSNINDRLLLLAGFIDSCGYLRKRKSYYEIKIKSRELVEDIMFVAHSLGLRTTKKKKINFFYCCKIMGNISKIPVKLEKNKTDFVTTEDNVSKFNLKYVGIDDFYGFELNSDHLYFTDDFLINHNSGKSIILYSIVKYLLSKLSSNILLIVPSISLVEQMYSDFKDYGWNDIEKYVDILYHGKKITNKRVLISTYQSIVNKGRNFFSKFKTILMDECHGLSFDAQSLQSILKKCENSKYKLGFTGTLPDEEIDLMTIFGYLGPKIFTLKTHELIEKNVLSELKIANIIYKYSDSVIKEMKNRPFVEEERFVESYESRFKIFNFIFKNFLNDGENTLILCRHIEHLKSIEGHFKTTLNQFKKVFVIYGQVKAEEREYLRKLMEIEKNMIIIGTYATMKQGINIKRLHNIIFASSYKSKISIIQAIGRSLRKSNEKDMAIIWDIVDDLRWTKRTGRIETNYLYDQFLFRLKYYKEQKFEYQTLKITDKDLI